MYKSEKESGKYGLLPNKAIVKINNWTEPDDGRKQEIYFKDEYGVFVWAYAYEFIAFGHKKRKLKKLTKK